MKFKSMLKITLSALLLLVGFSAFAAEDEGSTTGSEGTETPEAPAEPNVLTLKDGTPTTWSNFVGVLNGSITLPGSVSQAITKARDDAYKAYQDSLKAQSQVVKDVATAQTNYDDKTHEVTAWKDALTSAQGTYTNLQEQLRQLDKQLTAKKDTKAQYETNLKTLQGELDALNAALKKTITAPWLTEALGKVDLFKTSYDKETDAASAYYNCYKDGRSYVLTLSFTQPIPDNLTGGDSGSATITGKGLWDYLNEDGTLKKVSTLYVYLGEKDGTLNYPNNDGRLLVTYGDEEQFLGNVKASLQGLVDGGQYQEEVTVEPEPGSEEAQAISDKEEEIETCKGNISTVQGDINDLDAQINGENGIESQIATVNTTISNNTKLINEWSVDKDANGKTKMDLLKEALQWQQRRKIQIDDNVPIAKEAYDTAQANYDKALAESSSEGIANYKDAKLTDDVTVTTAISNFDGTLSGEGHVITLSGTNYLFTRFSGVLGDVAINNGRGAQYPSSPTYNRVAVWANGAGIYYDEDGKSQTGLTIGQLGFAARDYFGVDLVEPKLVDLSDATKVYNITVYTPALVNQQYVYYAGNGKFTNATYTTEKPLEIPENMFAMSMSQDLTTMLPNVFDKDGNCPNVVINDKKDFYCPRDITATSVTYNRKFKKSYNSVCLPFALSYDYEDETSPIRGLLTYDRADPKKFWFIVKTGTVEAYTPLLINARTEFSINDLELGVVTIKQTPASQIYKSPARPDGSISCGLLRKATSQEVAESVKGSEHVYALTTGGQFQPAGGTADDPVNFPALRMVISCPVEASSGAPMRAARRIGILDPNGVDITDDFTSGIEEVTAEVEEFSVAGGQGEITITSAANYGKVPVYAIDGKLVTVAEVVEGTTTVNVAGGMYIVMGKKVMVK